MRKQELSEEELNIFLEEIELFEPSQKAEKKSSGQSPAERKEKRAKRVRLINILSAAIVCSLLVGTCFGLFLGRKESIHPKSSERVEAIHAKLFSLIDELKKMYEAEKEIRLEYTFPKDEIIEPLPSPTKQPCPLIPSLDITQRTGIVLLEMKNPQLW